MAAGLIFGGIIGSTLTALAVWLSGAGLLAALIAYAGAGTIICLMGIAYAMISDFPSGGGLPEDPILIPGE